MATKKKNKPTYELPKFDIEKLLAHIQRCVDNAPHRIVTLVIDLFCGAGGTSEGLEQARSACGAKTFCIIAGINHDKKALYSQAKNHPLAYYSTEDIRTANLHKINELKEICKQRWPWLPVVIWASFDCTNHSNAKGGSSRDADSRTLPWHIFRYIKALNPDGLWVENVKEFSQWGPTMEKVLMIRGSKRISLDKKIERKKEKQFYKEQIKNGFICSCPLDKWKKLKKDEIACTPPPVYVPIKALKGIYYDAWRRKVESYGFNNAQWFLNAADYGVPQNRERFFPIFMKHGYNLLRPVATHAKVPKNGLKKHVPVKECLDFDSNGESIFTPGKIKSVKSYGRYMKGLIKFVAGGKKKYEQDRLNGVPARLFPVKGDKASKGIDSAYFLDVVYGNGTPSDIERSSPTVRTKDGLYLMDVNFLTNFQGQSSCNSIEESCPTVMCKDKLYPTKVEYFIYNNYSNGGQFDSIDKSAAAVTTNSKANLVGIQKIKRNRILLTSHYGGHSSSVDKPSLVVIARQDKSPLSLLITEEGYVAIPVFKTDPPIVVQIKEFMAMYGIQDIKTRPLFVRELLQIQSFPADYFLADGITDQKKMVGNAVPPLMARKIAESMYPGIVEYTLQTYKLAA